VKNFHADVLYGVRNWKQYLDTYKCGIQYCNEKTKQSCTWVWPCSFCQTTSCWHHLFEFWIWIRHEVGRSVQF